MKKSVLFAFVSLYLCLTLKAQCDLKPKIKPDNLILCPNTSDTLFVTKNFDTYQWYKFTKPIPGATQRYLKVSSQDAGSLFKVVVTKNGCTDTSKKILVDGYVFVLPTITTTGDPSYIDPNTGTPTFCKNDPVSLTLNPPYTVDVQWYDNGKAISGATNSTYKVSQSGSYTACGSTDICPIYRDCEGIPVKIVIDKSVATVTRSGDSLIASAGKKHQWYRNGTAIAGATKMVYVPSFAGLYVAEVTDKFNCTSKSNPVVFTPNSLINISPNPAYNFIMVHTNNKNAAQIIIADVYSNVHIKESMKSNNQKIAIDKLKSGIYMLHLMDNANNIIGAEKFVKN